jgi:hypothetical protein
MERSEKRRGSPSRVPQPSRCRSLDQELERPARRHKQGAPRLPWFAGKARQARETCIGEIARLSLALEQDSQLARSGTASRPPVKTCFAVGAVLRVCEVFRFLLEHHSLDVTLVLLLLVRAGSVISRRVLLHGREEAGAVSILAVEVSIACAA